MENERYIAIQSQEKFQFYLIALIFTLLGLSIQTYESHSYTVANALEVFSWSALLLSGLFGLSYLEWGPLIREKIAIENELDEKISYLRQMAHNGMVEVYVEQYSRTMPTENRINEFETHKGNVTKLIEGLEKKSLFKYRVLKWAFSLGVVSLVVARAFAPVAGIICS